MMFDQKFCHETLESLFSGGMDEWFRKLPPELQDGLVIECLRVNSLDEFLDWVNKVHGMMTYD